MKNINYNHWSQGEPNVRALIVRVALWPTIQTFFSIFDKKGNRKPLKLQNFTILKFCALKFERKLLSLLMEFSL